MSQESHKGNDEQDDCQYGIEDDFLRLLFHTAWQLSINYIFGLCHISPVYLMEVLAVAEDVEGSVLDHLLDIRHRARFLVLYFGIDGALEAVQTEVVKEAVLLFEIGGEGFHGHHVVGSPLNPFPIGNTHLLHLTAEVERAIKAAVYLSLFQRHNVIFRTMEEHDGTGLAVH